MLLTTALFYPRRRYAHRYIGKVCCLLLVQADYIGPRLRTRPRGHRARIPSLDRAVRTSDIRLECSASAAFSVLAKATEEATETDVSRKFYVNVR